MISDAQYSEAFFDYIASGSRRSAEIIIPMVNELISPKSVVDIGCGNGMWLDVWVRHGVCDILGVDGDYIARDTLVIPPSKFKSMDISLPFQLDRSFDMCTCLEVAEHLPQSQAGPFIESLARAARVILFSAAIPHQGGVHHINEQWQSYWAEMFASYDFVVFDCIRDKIWGHPEIKRWYQQNVILFVHCNAVETLPRLAEYPRTTDFKKLDKVHPLTYLRTQSRTESTSNLSTLGMKHLSRAMVRAMQRSLNQARSRLRKGKT